jgi:hypothetical protein
LPHDGYRHVDAFDTRENVGHEIAPLVGFGVSPVSDLIVCRAVDVVEYGPRQSPLSHRPKIPDVVASIDTHWLLHFCEGRPNEHGHNGSPYELSHSNSPGSFTAAGSWKSAASPNIVRGSISAQDLLTKKYEHL